MTYKKGLVLTLISRYFNICSSYQSFHCELQNLKHFLVTAIQFSLLVIALGLLDKIFSPKPPVHSCSKKIFSFAFHTLVSMVYKYAHNSTDYFHLLTHIYLFALSYVLYADCLIFSIRNRIPFTIRSHVVCQCCGALCTLTHHRLSRHNISDFTILTSGNSKFDLEMRESVQIKTYA